MNTKDVSFSRIHAVLDNVARQLHKDGVGVSKVQIRVITMEEEEQLWEKRIIGTQSPTLLLNGVYFYCGLHICLGGGDEHRNLKLSKFVIKDMINPSATDENIKCVVYTEHGSKNRTGSMHHVHLNNKKGIYYAKPSLGERCFVHLMELYLSKLPAAATEKDFFYCKPAKILVVGKAWYHNCPLGHNALRSKLKDYVCFS